MEEPGIDVVSATPTTSREDLGPRIRADGRVVSVGSANLDATASSWIHPSIEGSAAIGALIAERIQP